MCLCAGCVRASIIVDGVYVRTKLACVCECVRARVSARVCTVRCASLEYNTSLFLN